MLGWLTAVALAAPTPEQAAQALRDGDFATAAKGYAALTKASPEQGDAWFQLATAEMGRGRFTQAADGFARAAKLKFRPPLSTYNQACALARAGKTAEALVALEAAFTAGFPNPSGATADPDLASLVGNPELGRMLEAADRAAHPCAHDPRYDAFDYWVGTFDVFAGTQKIGTNTITREQAGCVLVERWTDGFGGTGTSFSFRDPLRDTWRQLWIAETGGVSEFEGTFDRPGHLVMEGRTAAATGPELTVRGTWTANDDGTVRQLFEQRSADGTWTVTFDAIYRRAP